MSISGSVISFFLGRQYDILGNLPVSVLVIDETGKIKYSNRYAAKLFETPNLIRKNINDYFIASSDTVIKNNEDGVKQILKIVTEKQNTKITDVKVTDVSSRGRKRYILMLTDTTEDHSLLNELIEEKQAQKAMSRTKNVFLSKMDNYLCSPLHSAAGFSQAMLSGLSGELNEKQRKYLEIINSNTSELLLIIQNLIALSKAEADVYKFEYTSFDITMLLAAAVNEFKVKIQDRDIKLSIDEVNLQSSSCCSDKNIIKFVIRNLLENAAALIDTGAVGIKLTNPLPELLLAKGFEIDGNTARKSYLACEVVCKGVNETIFNDDDMFDPYLQADKNSKKYLLQSLLLGSAKKFLSKIKGGIWISSQYSNQVSFVFAFPADKQTAEDN